MNENFKQNVAPGATPEEGFTRLNRIMSLLRSDCPWDKKQTFDTLRPLTIEEVFELSDALLDGDDTKICEELGDIIMHIAFYARVAEEENRFTFTDILNRICEKLIRRHPHIFGDERVNGDEDVKKNWEAIKLTEGRKHSVLAGVPHSLPSMIKAYRIQDKVRGVGFDWEKPEQVWDKVQEEITELREAAAVADTAENSVTNARVADGVTVAAAVESFTADTRAEIAAEATGNHAETTDNRAEVTGNHAEAIGNHTETIGNHAEATGTHAETTNTRAEAIKTRIKDELGDVFFALINYARFLGINPDDALEHTNRKFIKRFKYLEDKTIMQGRSLHDMTLDEMNVYWNEAKEQE
ncbi:MAG: nucleoside triphosphate pyrophosphohydrolase [Bacteroidales bacterium]|jgi:XTP/dITP diphosphohydrolase|nr:nucleoside triphosphate pyrophosphohydrolase [Bacteroidales bacterium]